MTTATTTDAEQATGLLERFDGLSRIELPSLERLGRQADETLDRVRGRRRRRWGWLVGIVAMTAIVMIVAGAWTMRRGRGLPTHDALERLDGMSEGPQMSRPDLGLTGAPAGTGGPPLGSPAQPEADSAALGHEPIEGGAA